MSSPGGAEAMGHTFSRLVVHVIFSTKARLPLITSELKNDLCRYLGGIVREVGGNALLINGTNDHLHALLELPHSLSVSDAMRLLKTNSSRWVHRKWPGHRDFAWQTGYAAFSVSRSNLPAALKYIREQEKHHRKVSFQDELLSFLEKHEIKYDKRFLWEE
jgi:putative transposase